MLQLHQSSAEFQAQPSFGRRLAGAVRRRAQYAVSRLAGKVHRPVVEAAYHRLLEVAGDGVPLLAGDARACPGATGAALATATAYGDDESAGRWISWLLTTQDPAGAFPDGASATPSLLNTAQTLRGLLTRLGCNPIRPAAHRTSFNPEPTATTSCRPTSDRVLSDAITRGCEYILGCFDRQGRLRRDEAAAGLLAVWAPPALQLSCLSPVIHVARHFDRPDWMERARTIAVRFRRSEDLARWDCVSHLFAAGVHGLIDLAEIEPGLLPAARAAMELAAGAQRADGSVPVLPREKWCSAGGTAGLAAAWYRLSAHDSANRAWDALAIRQLPSGGFPGSWGSGARYFPRREVTSATIGFLDATLLRVSAKFSSDDAAWFEIEPTDPRLESVLRWADQLPSGATVADLGCGHGRYLRQIGQRRPDVRLVGVDVSSALLENLPDNIVRRQGSLLRVPAADGEFDAVLAVESLEHSLLPQRAIGEMFRVLRPGGKLLVIDKDVAAQPLSTHEPWEQWFSPEQLSEWLSEEGEAVAFERIAPPGGRGRGVFLAWTATRRGQVNSRQAA